MKIAKNLRTSSTRFPLQRPAAAAFNGLFTLFLKSRFKDRKPPRLLTERYLETVGIFAPHGIRKVSMKSGGPWNLRGLLPEVREAARAAARQSGQSIGEWLNSVIKVVDKEDGEFVPSTGFDRFSHDGSRQSVRSDDRRQRDADWDDREADAQLRQHGRAENPEQDRRYRHAEQDARGTDGRWRQHGRGKDPEQDRQYRHANWDDREADAQLRQHGRAEDPERDRRYRRADWDDRETHGNWRRHLRTEDPQQNRRFHDADQDARETNGHWRQHPRAEVPQQNRRYHNADQDDRRANGQWRHAEEREQASRCRDCDDREVNDQSPHDYPAREREQESRYCDCNEREANSQSRQNYRAKERPDDRPYLHARRRDRASMEEAADRHYRGGPYREDRRSDTRNPRRTQARSAEESHYPTHGDRETAIDQVASEIRTRQRELEAIDRGRGGYRSDQPPSEKRQLVTAPSGRRRIRS